MGLWRWIKGLFGKKIEQDEPPTSLVFLLREPRDLDKRTLEQAVQGAFGVDLSGAGKDSTEFVVGGEGLPTSFIQFQGHTLLVHNFPIPYMKDKEATAKDIADLRLRQAVTDHTAWLSVDSMNCPEAEDPYHVIGKLLAELADEDCLAILSPALERMVPWESALAETLRGPEPLDAVRETSQVPVIDVPADDPLMRAAVAEARQSWPEFVAAFERRQPDQKFSVKAPFSEGEAKEFMWLTVESIEEDTVYGRLGNDPVNLKMIRLDSRVHVRAMEICDWLYTEGEEMRGGFSLEAVKKAAQRGKT